MKLVMLMETESWVKETRSYALSPDGEARVLGSPPTPAAVRRICSKLSLPVSEPETIREHEMPKGCCLAVLRVWS
jgi:hypothetical protein